MTNAYLRSAKYRHVYILKAFSKHERYVFKKNKKKLKNKLSGSEVGLFVQLLLMKLLLTQIRKNHGLSFKLHLQYPMIIAPFQRDAIISLKSQQHGTVT
jgi:hypothetical protein